MHNKIAHATIKSRVMIWLLAKLLFVGGAILGCFCTAEQSFFETCNNVIIHRYLVRRGF